MSSFSKILTKNKYLLISLTLITFGVIYKLIITSDGNFIFNMDNARDFIDVREMVILHKLRLISNTSGIEGFYIGPAWYYLLSIPFILTSGNPYGAIFLMITLWAIGGYFLYLLIKNLGFLSITAALSIWISSNFIMLSTLYSYNPNPVILLMPMFIYLFLNFLKSGRLIFAISTGFLAGLFFNFEVVFGIFMPPVLFLGVLILNKKLFRIKSFYLLFLSFLVALLPQILFDIRHNFMMIHSLTQYLTNHSTGSQQLNLSTRAASITNIFYNTLQGTFMNWPMLLNIFLILTALVILELAREKKFLQNQAFIISLLLFLVPLLGLIFSPINVYSWHIGGSMAAVIILVPFVLYSLQSFGKVYKLFAISTALIAIFYSFYNLELPKLFIKERTLDQSVYKNEISAIDYVYKIADNKNFKVYTYLPSVYDYPYQYLFWWYGLKTYGYTPSDFAYLPNKFPYITSKDKFSTGANPPGSGLVFLIKEPDSDPSRRKLWENYFINYPKTQTSKIGRIEIETRKDFDR